MNNRRGVSRGSFMVIEIIHTDIPGKFYQYIIVNFVQQVGYFKLYVYQFLMFTSR
jgi:hypothetical protein